MPFVDRLVFLELCSDCPVYHLLSNRFKSENMLQSNTIRVAQIALRR